MVIHGRRSGATIGGALARVLSVAAAATVWAATPARSQSDSLTVAQAVAAARQANPMLQAARLRADAAAERVSAAGTLPDPALTLSLMNRPISGFGTGEMMTMNQVQVEQMLPWPGKLRHTADRARLLAAAERLDAAEAEAQLVARVETTYYEVAYMDRAIAIMGRTRDLLRDFLQVSETRYAVGAGLQQDVLQAQVSIARMTEDITVMERNRVAMAARLNALLGREATAPVGRLDLPGPPTSTDPARDSASDSAGGRPAIAAAETRARAAEAGYLAARRELYPDLRVGLAYGQRPQYDDMASVMVGFSLPIWAGRRQLPMRREMAAMRASEEAMARDLRNETFAELTELRAEAGRARELSRLFATSVLPQARAAVESALASYRVGRADFMTLVESEMTVNRYEIELVRLAATYQQARARAAALVGSEESER